VLRAGKAKKATKGRLDTPGLTESEDALKGAAERLDRLAERLTRSLDEVPKATDFEPLAEHLYEFARQAPALGASLQELPKVAGPLAGSVKTLLEVSDTLQQANQSFSEALLRLPRAEDYEPLAAPLREFARVSPALAAALREVLAVASPLAAMAAPLGEAVRGLAHVSATLEATGRELARTSASFGSDRREARPADPVPPEGLAELERRLDAAHESILEALAGLPRSSDYEPAARQLKELASVSPSLMEWLREVPTLSAPLTESVRALQAAAADLKTARGLVRAFAGETDPDKAAEMPRPPEGR
jgi:ABC-type transporter Mla subunit MlaD